MVREQKLGEQAQTHLTPGGLPRRVAAVVLLAIIVALPLALAGCVATGDDDPTEVLKDISRSSPDDDDTLVTFNVPSGIDRIRISVSTASSDSTSGLPGCGSWCNYDAGGDTSSQAGRVSLVIASPSGKQVVTLQAAGGDSASETVSSPEPGTWAGGMEYEDGYDGPARMRAMTTDSASTPLIGGSFWDILGVILAITGLVGGFILYRRRGRFLTRELHRIDNTVRVFKDDVDECRTNLHDLQDHIKGLLVKRKIEENQYLILEKRIERYLSDLDTPGNRHQATVAAAKKEVAGLAGPASPTSHQDMVDVDLEFEDETDWQPM